MRTSSRLPPNLFGARFEGTVKARTESLKLLSADFEPSKKIFSREPSFCTGGQTARCGRQWPNKWAMPPTSRLPHSSFRQRPAQFTPYSSKEFVENYQSMGLQSQHFTGSRKVTILPRQLGSGVPRPLGRPGIQTGIPKRASSNFPPKGGQFISPGAEPHTGGDSVNASKGGNNRVTTDRSFYLSLFLVPKKDGGLRPVINLKKLNEFIAPHHFKMEGIHTLKDLLRKGDWMTKVDLKDAYFMIPIHQSDRSASLLLPVQLPTIQPVMRSLGLYQDPEASCSESLG